MIMEKYGFKIGQKVRLVDGGGGAALNGFKDGKEYEIVDFDPFGVDDCIKIGCSGLHGYASPDQIETISETTTTVTGPATVTVAAGETITFTGNATVKQEWVPEFGDKVVFNERPEDMIGDFGVVIEVDDDDLPYEVAYDCGGYYNTRLATLDAIKPYEAE